MAENILTKCTHCHDVFRPNPAHLPDVDVQRQLTQIVARSGRSAEETIRESIIREDRHGRYIAKWVPRIEINRLHGMSAGCSAPVNDRDRSPSELPAPAPNNGLRRIEQDEARGGRRGEAQARLTLIIEARYTAPFYILQHGRIDAKYAESCLGKRFLQSMYRGRLHWRDP